jgi:hypothetical protein
MKVHRIKWTDGEYSIWMSKEAVEYELEMAQEWGISGGIETKNVPDDK